MQIHYKKPAYQTAGLVEYNITKTETQTPRMELLLYFGNF